MSRFRRRRDAKDERKKKSNHLEIIYGKTQNIMQMAQTEKGIARLLYKMKCVVHYMRSI